MENLHTDRIIILVDMDCFYCQVEEKLNPKLIGKPIAVVQYNAWKGGGIIAVNYPARDKGVTRHMRGNEAKEKCPDIKLVRVPTVREKADLTKYRDAGKEVAAVLHTFTDLLERASVDEAYLDITDEVNKRIQAQHAITIDQLTNTHVVGCSVEEFLNSFKEVHYLDSNLKLCMGGIIAEEIRAAVFNKTGYRCSAGIAHNKILAKLACGMHKPNQQTILPHDSIDELFASLPLRKIKSLGGKFGSNLGEDLGIKTVGELKQFSEKDLINKYDDKTGSWLYKIARGIDLEPVTVRLVSKSIGCCKKFPGRTALKRPEDVLHWINELSAEISERLQKDFEENNRKAKHVVVGFVQEVDRKDISSSRTHSLTSYESEKIAADMLKVINKYCFENNGFYRIKYLSISAGKFEDYKKNYDITSFFKNMEKQINSSNLESKSISDTETKLDIEVEEISQVVERILTPKILTDTDNICDYNTIDTDSVDSVFSEDTVVIDSDETHLIYNENYENIASVLPCDSDSDTDSISGEIVNSYEKLIDSANDSSSYFSNYFSNIETHNRNFNTSRYLEKDNATSSESDTLSQDSSNSACEKFMDKTESMKLISISKDPQKNTVDTFNIFEPTSITTETMSSLNGASHENNSYMPNVLQNHPDCANFFDRTVDDSKERCKECNKLILKTEITSHMDYHFAIQMVRSEAHLYPIQNNILNPPKQAPEIKQTKRKRNEVLSGSITSFFKNKPMPPDTPTETCPECNKVVASDEFTSHLDYHVAQKLHCEINFSGNISSTSQLVIKNINKRSKQEATSQNKSPSVMSFFKRNM